MTILLAIIAGIGIGYIFERGDFCFHSTLRGLFQRPHQLDLFRAYLLILLIAIPLVNGLIYFGIIEPWIAPLAWRANLIGGVIFGVGMVVAATCVTGLFYKLGHGMLGTLVALVTWGIGDVLTYRGPLSGLRDSLNANPLQTNGQTATFATLLGSATPFILAIVGIAVAVYLIRSPQADRGKLWNWKTLGLAAGIFTAFAWLLANWGGSNYTYGTSSVPSQIVSAVVDGNTFYPWITVALFTQIIGAFIASVRSGTLWVRGEDMKRFMELGAGGLLMGVGAGISGGCNLGHSLVGVPLLSLGSIVSTLSMGLGVFMAARLLHGRDG